MTKFTEHAIGQRRGSSVNSEYISDVMKNSNSFVPKDLSSGYRENRKTGKLELVTETSDPEKEYETKCENKICFGTFNSNNNTNTIDLLVKVNKKERLGDFQLTQRSAFAIRDMVKRFDFETQESLRWKGEWNANAKTFTMNKEDKEDLFVGAPTFLFEISFKEVKRSQGRNILKAHQSGTSLNTKMKIEAILTW